MALVYNPDTGQYEWDYSNGGPPNSQAPWDPATGQDLPAPGNTPGWDVTNGGWQAAAPGPTAQDPAPTPSPTPTPQPNPGSAFTPFTGSFNAPAQQPLPQLPTVPNAPPLNLPPLPQKPPAFSFEDWKAPSVDEVLSDPSYGFRKSQGEDSLQHWAAAKGTLNDSGTAHALIDYGQNAASQEYAQIWNRDRDTYQMRRQNAVGDYNTNYQTQYTDPYKFAYQSSIDAYQPQFAQWQQGNNLASLGYTTQANAAQHSNDMAYANAFNMLLNQQDMYKYKINTGIDVASR